MKTVHMSNRNERVVVGSQELMSTDGLGCGHSRIGLKVERKGDGK